MLNHLRGSRHDEKHEASDLCCRIPVIVLCYLDPSSSLIAAPSNMCYNRKIRFATGILVLVCSSVLLDVVEATNNKNRRDAMTAGQPSKPKRGAAGKKEGSTQSRAERYATAFTAAHE